MREVYRDRHVHVMARKCSTCIFRPGNLMGLRPGRVDQMEQDSVADEGVIVCHKTLDGNEPAICRGYFDRNKRHVGLLSAAERMGVLREVDETP